MGGCLGKGAGGNGAPRYNASAGGGQVGFAGENGNGGGGRGGNGGYNPPQISKADQLAAQFGLPDNAEERERGCYLVFDPASGGCLLAHWSETTVEGAWAFFFPRANVPAFKFKQNGGRAELIRGLAVNKQKLFNGWSQFFKLAYDLDGVMEVYDKDDGQADFWFLNEKLTVNQIPMDEYFEAREISALAVVPKHNQAYKGIQKTTEEAFIDTAKGALGYSWKPLRK